MKCYIAEALGTFALVFCGTGAIIINAESGGQIGHAGIAATFGLIVTAMIYTFGGISGAHLNPAVSISFALAGLFKWRLVAPYILSQALGGVAASAVLKFLFPGNETLGATVPVGSMLQSFVLEGILTFILMLVILFTSQGAKETGVMAGIAIGGTVLLEAMFAGPISGASMNPVRSLAPALLSGNLNKVWLYLVAPVMGAALATILWRWMRAKEKA
ncbi:MAG: family channel protein [Flaviaesturariibacter sp.]|nr:family channel protein [Flaviaesturariibacter sp.]